jgi:hypothetical protein
MAKKCLCFQQKSPLALTPYCMHIPPYNTATWSDPLALQVFATCMHAYPPRPARSRVFFIPVVLPTVRPCTATGRRRRGRGRRRRRGRSSARRHCGGRRRRAGPDELLRGEVQDLRRRRGRGRGRERRGAERQVDAAAAAGHHHELRLRRLVGGGRLGVVITATAAPAALQQLRVLHEVRVRHHGLVLVPVRRRHCCQRHRALVLVVVVPVRDAAGYEEAQVGAALDALREVELGLGALEPERGLVVGDGGVLRRVEGAKPHPRRLLGVPDLRRPLPPRPLPHPSVVPPPTCCTNRISCLLLVICKIDPTHNQLLAASRSVPCRVASELTYWYASTRIKYSLAI